MAWSESLDAFFGDMAVDSTLAGAPVRAIVDTETVSELADGSLTQQPTALLTTAAAAAAAPGQAFVGPAGSYQVRRVLREPPDGVLTRLVLVRV